MIDGPSTRPRKGRHSRASTQQSPSSQPPGPDGEPPRGPDFEVDVAPDLVDRGPGTERDRDSICSLPEDES